MRTKPQTHGPTKFKPRCERTRIIFPGANFPDSKSSSLGHGFTIYVKGYEVGYIFLVSPKGHQTYSLTNIKKEPSIHSPKAVIYTLVHIYVV